MLSPAGRKTLLDTRQLMELGALRSMLASPPRGRSGRREWTLTEDAQRRGWMAVRGLQRSWSACLGRPRPPRPDATAGVRQPVRFADVVVVPEDVGRQAAGRVPPVAVVRDPRTDGGSSRLFDEAALAACAELFVSEPVIRLWCLLLTEYAESRDCESARQFARNLVVAQYQTRQLALAFVASSPERAEPEPDSADTSRTARLPGVTTGAGLDRLRRIGERWTDLLLANRLAHPQTAELVFDQDRAEEFAGQLALLPSAPQPAAAWELALVSIRTVYPAFPWAQSPRTQLARGLAEAILATFPPEAFTSSGSWLPPLLAHWRRFGMSPQ